MNRIRIALAPWMLCALAACGGGGGGGGGGSGEGGSSASSAASSQTSSSSSSQASSDSASSGSSQSSQPTLAQRNAAAQATATGATACQAVSPFYYELGDGSGALASASVGDGSYTASSLMPIASASKWLFGAYVAEIRGGVLTQADIRATHMLSGYASMSNVCGSGATVESCFTDSGNDTYTDAKLDRFNYNAGHFQKWGVDHGMGGMTGSAVASAYQSTLGVTTYFNGPLLAGGVITTPSAYAVFLRRILNGQLRIASLLGSTPTCTQPSSCATADYSPLTAEAWHYSVGHWVEDDPVTGDGSFSSAGAFGFYPWVDATRSHYGILARMDSSGDNQGYASAQCGRLIRQAWLSGVAR